MILLSGFLEVLLKALALIGFSISVGGIVFSLAVLQGNKAQSGLEQQGLRQSGAIIAAGAILQALSLVALLLVEPWALADDLGKWGPRGRYRSLALAGAPPALPHQQAPGKSMAGVHDADGIYSACVS